MCVFGEVEEWVDVGVEGLNPLLFAKLPNRLLHHLKPMIQHQSIHPPIPLTASSTTLLHLSALFKSAWINPNLPPFSSTSRFVSWASFSSSSMYTIVDWAPSMA